MIVDNTLTFDIYISMRFASIVIDQTALDMFCNLPLKGLAQAKIIKKSVILFWLLNMTI